MTEQGIINIPPVPCPSLFPSAPYNMLHLEVDGKAHCGSEGLRLLSYEDMQAIGRDLSKWKHIHSQLCFVRSLFSDPTSPKTRSCVGGDL